VLEGRKAEQIDTLRAAALNMAFAAVEENMDGEAAMDVLDVLGCCSEETPYQSAEEASKKAQEAYMRGMEAGFKAGFKVGKKQGKRK